MARRSGTKAPPEGPVAEMKISDLETIRVMSDPLRLRIVQAMSTDIEQPWTVKRLAGTLSLPPTKLYYHVNLLEQHGLIKVIGTGIVSGIVESRYAIAARRFEVDRAVFAPAGAERTEVMGGLVTTIFDTTRDEVLYGVRAGRITTGDTDRDPQRRLTISKNGVRLNPVRAAELRERIEAVIAAFDSDNDPDGINIAALVAIYPIEA